MIAYLSALDHAMIGELPKATAVFSRLPLLEGQAVQLIQPVQLGEGNRG